MYIPTPKEAILINYNPKIWVCPLNIFEYNTPVSPGLVQILLGNWDIRSPDWPVQFTTPVSPGVPAIPILFMKEVFPPGQYDFTLSLIDYSSYERLELR